MLWTLFTLILQASAMAQDTRDLRNDHERILREMEQIGDEYERHEKRAEEMVAGLREQSDRNTATLLTVSRDLIPAVRDVAASMEALNANLERQRDDIGRVLDYVMSVALTLGAAAVGLRQTKFGGILGERRGNGRRES